MIGIVVEDFDLLLKKSSCFIEDVTEKKSDINQNCSELVSNFNDEDIMFIISKLSLELKQFENILKKINAYQTALLNVYKSYDEYATMISENMKKFTS